MDIWEVLGEVEGTRPYAERLEPEHIRLPSPLTPAS